MSNSKNVKKERAASEAESSPSLMDMLASSRKIDQNLAETTEAKAKAALETLAKENSGVNQSAQHASKTAAAKKAAAAKAAKAAAAKKA